MRCLQAEPDIEKIHVQVQKQVYAAIREHCRKLDDLRISFSSEGLSKAMAQTVPGMDPWGPANVPTRYMTIPFTTNIRQRVDVLVELSDGRPVDGR